MEGRWWGGIGGGKNAWLRQPLSTITPLGAHTMAYATLVGHRDVLSAVGAILGPYHVITPSIGAIVLVMILEGRQNAHAD